MLFFVALLPAIAVDMSERHASVYLDAQDAHSKDGMQDELEVASAELVAEAEAFGSLAEALVYTRDDDGPTATVTLPFGAVVGRQLQDVNQFLGVPYAARPVRFAEPVAWTADYVGGSLDAMRSVRCPGYQFSVLGSVDEDCLKLDVFAPRADGPPRPVLLWFGEANGTHLAAAEDVLVVVASYRTGVLGFGVTRKDGSHTGAPVANNGYKDQREAMRWVRAHAKAFGGDPKRVTIAGSGAEGRAVHAHVVSPGSKGLFDRAIAQSSDLGSSVPVEEALRAMGALATAVGCADAADLVCLQDADLRALLRQHGADEGHVIGDTVLPQPLEKLAASGFADVPILSTTNADEGNSRWLLSNGWFYGALSAPEAQCVYDGLSPSHSRRLMDTYGKGEDGDYRPAVGALLGDAQYHCSGRRFLHALRDAGHQKLWAASFRVGGTCGEDAWGAYHGSEVPLVFGTLPCKPTAEAAALAEAVGGAWAAFARDGAPPAAMAWLPLAQEDRTALLNTGISTTAPVETALAERAKECVLLDSLQDLPGPRLLNGLLTRCAMSTSFFVTVGLSALGVLVVLWTLFYYCFKYRRSAREVREDSVTSNVFICLLLTNYFLTVDYVVMPATIMFVKSEMNLTDTEIGLSGSVVYFGLTVSSLLSGVLFARVGAQQIMQYSLLFSAGASLLSGLSWNKPVLLVARFLVGLGHGPAYVYFPVWVDSFAPQGRETQWMGLYTACGLVANLGGYATAALLTYWFELSWRHSYIVPALLVLVASLNCWRVPAELWTQSRSDGGDAAASFKALHSYKSFWALMIVPCTAYYACCSVEYWAIPMAVHLGLPEAQAPMMFLGAGILGPACGIFVGAAVVDYFGGYRNRQRAIEICCVFTACSFITFPWLFFPRNPTQLVWSTGGSMFFYGMALPVLNGLVMDSLPRNLKAQGSSVFGFMIDACGFMFAPLISGLITDNFGILQGWRSGFYPGVVAPLFLLWARSLLSSDLEKGPDGDPFLEPEPEGSKAGQEAGSAPFLEPEPSPEE